MTNALDAYLYFHTALVAEARELATSLAEPLGDDRARHGRPVGHQYQFASGIRRTGERRDASLALGAPESGGPIEKQSVGLQGGAARVVAGDACGIGAADF